MTKSPLRIPSGDIGCPKCETNLKIEKAPFILHDEYVGHFEALVCPICNYFVLTSQGYQDALTEAKKYGLVGPAEVREIDSMVEERITVKQNIGDINLLGIFISKYNENVSFEPSNEPPEFIIPEISKHKHTKLQINQQ